ncbi:DsbA family protein [Photobacterium sp. TY1-4]|uniref:DsbA family protein n=1 Tax=Photobacterium sp. TY1-4 TaxID=2899122 RepID=UPI0021C25087|nr:DsbA family protein [Photobacterium sp. TY1-4]UXI02454.1 DsbA family protein [Photobacterium sp. TY1-4]
MVTVHYFFDPMCGWCYGASSLIEQLNQRDGVSLVLHPGGMVANRAIDPSFRQHILQHDQQIARETGAEFGDAYVARIKSTAPIVMDSYLTAQAILATDTVGGDPLEMLRAIQQGHYRDGLAVNQIDTLAALTEEIGLDESAWRAAMTANEAQLHGTITRTRQLMTQYQVSGYPTLMLETEQGWQKVAPSSFYRREAQWQGYWDGVLATDASVNTAEISVMKQINMAGECRPWEAVMRCAFGTGHALYASL